MKKKSSTSGEIVFLLVSPIHVRNYIETGVLKDVAKTHNCFFLCPDTLKLPPNFTRDHKVIHFRPIGHSQHRFVFNLMMFVNRKKSSTFEPDFCSVRLESDPWIVQPTEHYEEFSIEEIIKKNQ